MQGYHDHRARAIAAGKGNQQRIGFEPIDVNEQVRDCSELPAIVTADFPPPNIKSPIGYSQRSQLGERTHVY